MKLLVLIFFLDEKNMLFLYLQNCIYIHVYSMKTWFMSYIFIHLDYIRKFHQDILVNICHYIRWNLLARPERVSSGGKEVAAVTSATRVWFAQGGTIYIVWIPGKKVKTPFFTPKKKKNLLASEFYQIKTIQFSMRVQNIMFWIFLYLYNYWFDTLRLCTCI